MSAIAFVIAFILSAVAILAAVQGSLLHSKAEKLMSTEPAGSVLVINLTHGIISLSIALVLLMWLWWIEQTEAFVPSTPMTMFFFWDLMIMGFLIRWCVMTRKAVNQRLRGECPRSPCRSCPVRDGKIQITVEGEE